MTDKGITSEIEIRIKSISKKFESCKKVKEYEASLDQFEQLIKLGVAEKRGNNLLSATDVYLKNISASSSSNKSIERDFRFAPTPHAGR